MHSIITPMVSYRPTNNKTTQLASCLLAVTASVIVFAVAAVIGDAALWVCGGFARNT